MTRFLAHVVCRSLEVLVAIGVVGAAMYLEQALGV